MYGIFSTVASLVSRTLHVARYSSTCPIRFACGISNSIHRAQQCPVKVSSGPTLKIRDPAPRSAINNRASLQPRITPAASVIVLREPLPFTCYRSLITSLLLPQPIIANTSVPLPIRTRILTLLDFSFRISISIRFAF